MRRHKVTSWSLAVAFWLALAAGPACAQPPEGPPAVVRVPGVVVSFVRLGNGVPGVLYEPAKPGPKARIAVFVMHSAADYLTHSACSELSRRGYRVLCANDSNSRSGLFDDGRLDEVLLEAKLGITFLRDYPGVSKIVLFGHSGGATVMTAYQAIAESGVRLCRDPEKIHKCPDSLAGLPPADGVVLGDANWGLAAMTLFSIDPAVLNNDSGLKLDPALDMYNPKNGFRPTGSNYSPEFVSRFLRAEGRRNNELIKLAQDRLAEIEARHGEYLDDEPFIVPGASLKSANNRLFAQDVRLLSHTQQRWPLLHADGSTTVEVVHSVRVPQNTQNPTPDFRVGALKTTVRSFLDSYAIRTTDDFGYDESSIHGVVWRSTYASPPGNVEDISAPLLALGMTGHWEALAAETIYDHARSKDKTIAFIEGATHSYTPCRPCERTPGQFGNTVKMVYDYVDAWLSKPGRF